jgi:hypothetical protein
LEHFIRTWKAISFLGLLLLVFFTTANAQNGYREGFVLTLKGDTIIGQIDYKIKKLNYESISFTTGSEEKILQPVEILGFGFENEKFYSSRILRNYFVEVLIEGKLSLYKYQDEYLIRKDGKTYFIRHQMTQLNDAGNIIWVDDTRWKGIISFLINDCQTEGGVDIESIDIREKSLVKLVENYNQCSGQPYDVYKIDKPWTKFNAGISIGMIHSNLSVRNEDHEYMDDSYTDVLPSIGAIFHLSSPRITERVVFQGEVYYSESNFASLINVNGIVLMNYYETRIAFSTISIPLSIKYVIPERAIGMSIQAGMNIDVNFDAEATLYSEEKVDNIITTNPASDAFEISRQQFGVWGGLGLHKSIKGLTTEIGLRYFVMPGLNNSADFAVTANRFELKFNLYLLQ